VNSVDTVSRPARRLSAARNERYVEELTWQQKTVRLAKRVVSTASPRLSQPNTWSIGLVAVLALVLVFQGSIAQLLGTAAHNARIAATGTGAEHVTTGGGSAVTPVHPVKEAPKHAPVDPFRPLVASDGSLVASQTIHVGKNGQPSTTTTKSGPSKSGHGRGATNADCAAVHVVTAGESLWSIAQGLAATTGRSVNATWVALLDDNRATIGANPDLLAVGEKLCLPTRRSVAHTAASHSATSEVSQAAAVPSAQVLTAAATTPTAPSHTTGHRTAVRHTTTVAQSGRTGRFGSPVRSTTRPTDPLGSNRDHSEAGAAAGRDAGRGRRARGVGYRTGRSGGLLPA
jgi:hypothetical protein